MNTSEAHDQRSLVVRRAILDELRRLDESDRQLGEMLTGQQSRPPRGIETLVQQIVTMQKASNHETWFEVFQLVNQGVLLPLPAAIYDNARTTLFGSSMLPSYVLSDFGRRFLATTKDQPDPYQADSVLRPLRDKGIINETVDAYIADASRALGARAFLGVVVLVGVAAEAVSEDIFKAFKSHLPESESTSFEQALDSKRTSAEHRWKTFTARFPQRHSACLGDELSRRFENVLETQLRLFKQNRDDAAHRRATLIGPETAQAAITSFVPFGFTAADVLLALRRPCIASSKKADA